MRQDNFRDRYIIKLVSSVIIASLNIVLQTLLPRVLSVESYGYYTYNLNIFTSVVAVANLSATNAMSSKFSKRNEEIGLIIFYIKFWIVMVIVLNISVMVLYMTNFVQNTLSGQTIMTTLLALESVIITKFFSDNIGIFDAMAISRYPAAMQILLKIILTIVVLAGYFMGRLSLAYFYSSQIIVTTFIVMVMLRSIFTEQKRLYPKVIDHGTKAYMREYYEFCKPLVLSSTFAQAIIIFMNWSLMRWSGYVHQAMFGAAWQLNILVSYIFSPYAELSRREFAVLCEDRELLRNRLLFSFKIMMWVTCYFAIFIGVESPWILPIIYGDKYNEATFVTLLIMVYTVYQAWGQLEGAFYIATEKAKLYAWISVAGQMFTLALTFFFQIPNFIWPESLGAVGMAMTYVVSNFVITNVSLFIVLRLVGTLSLKNMASQFIPIAICGSVSFLLRWILDTYLPGSAMGDLIGKVLIGGSVYTGVIFLTIWLKPGLINLSREQILSIRKIKKEVK